MVGFVIADAYGRYSLRYFYGLQYIELGDAIMGEWEW